MTYQVFIVRPLSSEDTLFVACKSNQPGTPDDLYMEFRYEEIERGSLEEAASAAVKQAVALGLNSISLV